MQVDITIKTASVEDLMALVSIVRGASAEVHGYDDLDEAIADSVISERISKIETEERVLRGALEETILKVAEIQSAARGAAAGRKNGMQGVYCLHCGKRLEKSQRLFCTPGHAAKWRHDHPGEEARPRLTLEGERPGMTVVAGEGVRD